MMDYPEPIYVRIREAAAVEEKLSHNSDPAVALYVTINTAIGYGCVTYKLNRFPTLIIDKSSCVRRFNLVMVAEDTR